MLEYHANDEVKYLNSKDVSKNIVLIFIFPANTIIAEGLTALNQNLKDNLIEYLKLSYQRVGQGDTHNMTPKQNILFKQHKIFGSVTYFHNGITMLGKI